MEYLGLVVPVQADRVLGRPRCSEVVGVAADGDYQRVVRDLPPRDQLAALFIQGASDLDHASAAVKPVHLTQLETKVMPPRLRQVVERMVVEIHAAGDELVEQRLPQMGARAIHQ